MTVWTAPMIDMLIPLWGKHSCREITAKINQVFGVNLTKASIIGRAHRSKLPPQASPIKRHWNSHERRLKEAARQSGLADTRRTIRLEEKNRIEQERLEIKRAQRDESIQRQNDMRNARKYRKSPMLLVKYESRRCGCGNYAVPGGTICYDH